MLKTKYFVIMMMFLFLISCLEQEKLYYEGVYNGTSEGYYSQLIVEVTVDDYNIISIEVLENIEPPILAEIVFEELPPRIIKKNGVDVDEVSGATYTSRALLKAVEDALKEARRDQ